METLNNGKDAYKYTYDIYGNITSVAKNGTVTEEYEYDELNQLIYAKIGEDEYAYTYACNNSSNLEFVYKNGKIIKTYGYMPAGETWVDKLNSFTGTGIDYDEIGNPLNWRDSMSFTWEYGRRLKGVTKGNDTISYTYDADALRTSKTVNGTTTDYYWLDGVLQGQKTGNEHIIFLYDENGTAYGMLVNDNGTESYYYYLFNLQGDIVGIMDNTGNTVVEYTYDAWGQLLSTTGALADTIGQKNPLRYRGYYYDTETGFYYLQSRYYDPYVQRFINADSLMAGVNSSVQGYNLFAYCFNDPVNMSDPTGHLPEWAKATLRVVATVFINATITPIIISASPDPITLTLVGVANTVGLPTAAAMPSKQKHYSRNENNIEFPKTYNEEFFNDQEWDDTVSANCHQFTAINRDNKKYVSRDGRYEVIYDINDRRVDDPKDVGTYNFASPNTNPLGHAVVDVLPWILYGNSPDDSTTGFQRGLSMIEIYV